MFVGKQLIFFSFLVYLWQVLPYFRFKVIVDVLIEETHIDQQTYPNECVVETIVDIRVDEIAREDAISHVEENNKSNDHILHAK